MHHVAVDGCQREQAHADGSPGTSKVDAVSTVDTVPSRLRFTTRTGAMT